MSPLTRSRRMLALLAILAPFSKAVEASEWIKVNESNYRKVVPRGKEVDAIYGDFVLKNEHISVVIASPSPDRHANMTVRAVGGQIIDLTANQPQSDQLSCYYSLANKYAFVDLGKMTCNVDGTIVDGDVAAGKKIEVTFVSKAAADGTIATLTYRIDDESRGVTIETTISNPTDKTAKVAFRDSVRADKTFEFGNWGESNRVWFQDEWFGQAYSIEGVGIDIIRPGDKGTSYDLVDDGKVEEELAAGQSSTRTRVLSPARDTLQLKGISLGVLEPNLPLVNLSITDPAKKVANVRVQLVAEGRVIGIGRTDEQGIAKICCPAGEYELRINSQGRVETNEKIEVKEGLLDLALQIPEPGYLQVHCRDGEEKPIPFKLSLKGLDGTPDPNFGPDSLAWASQNAAYSHDGELKLDLLPGKYQYIASRGPEYDIALAKFEVVQGKVTELSPILPRVVDTTGWVSTDFHSHSTPSGDNTSDQLGRVLNLIAEQVEFAPCTEHNRIDTYEHHLEALKAYPWIKSCTGMELTGGPLPVNHQNAFPLKRKPYTQDGGAPVTDINPIVQIERLAMWDDGSEKLVQANHPDLVQIYSDINKDGVADAGVKEMFKYMDVMEIHPPADIFKSPEIVNGSSKRPNTMFYWMQLLNLGYRIPGVINMDAHYNFHGSGAQRNFVRSSTDDPSKIDVMEMVHESEKGHIVVSTGPFMTVELVEGGKGVAIPGDLVAVSEKKARLRIKVQCANWLDIDRVQVFVNGRPEEKYNFTRRDHGEKFGNGVVKFEQEIEIELTSDAHLIVAAVDEEGKLGPVMGPTFGNETPIAVANPIYVDVDGGGFKANGDGLGKPFPIVQQ